MRVNCVHEGEEAMNDKEEDLKSLEDWRRSTTISQRTGASPVGNRKRCVMFSSCHTKVPVLISIISAEELFNHSWRRTCATTARQICVPQQLPGRQDLLPLQPVNCFFHCNWSTTSSIAPGQGLLPLQVVNFFFHCSWSTTSSVATGQLPLPLQVVNFFFQCSWSKTSSIAAGIILLPLQLVYYFFHCIWSTTCSIAAGQLHLPLQVIKDFFHCRWSTSSIAAGQLFVTLQMVN